VFAVSNPNFAQCQTQRSTPPPSSPDVVVGALASFQDGAAAAAIIGHGARDVPWQDELVTVIKRHSRDPD
jgi:hypothetical protein